jgi:hypothetical protein
MKANRHCQLQYFLIRELGSNPPTEGRTLRWEEEFAAFELLTFSEAKAALMEAAKVAREF